MCWNTTGSVVLCNDASVTVEAGSDGNNPSTEVYRFDFEWDSRNGVQDIENPDFWKCLYIILRAVFPALCLLRYCDKSKPAMDKTYYLSHRTTQALVQSESVLNDEALFGQITSDRNLGRALEIIGGVSR